MYKNRLKLSINSIVVILTEPYLPRLFHAWLGSGCDFLFKSRTTEIITQ